jgi:hypothetical protein
MTFVDNLHFPTIINKYGKKFAFIHSSSNSSITEMFAKNVNQQ